MGWVFEDEKTLDTWMELGREGVSGGGGGGSEGQETGGGRTATDDRRVKRVAGNRLESKGGSGEERGAATL